MTAYRLIIKTISKLFNELEILKESAKKYYYNFDNVKNSNPRETWKIDDKIWVRYDKYQMWVPKHYAGEQDGKCLVYYDGGTSHTLTPMHTMKVDQAISDAQYRKLSHLRGCML